MSPRGRQQTLIDKNLNLERQVANSEAESDDLREHLKLAREKSESKKRVPHVNHDFKHQVS